MRAILAGSHLLCSSVRRAIRAGLCVVGHPMRFGHAMCHALRRREREEREQAGAKDDDNQAHGKSFRVWLAVCPKHRNGVKQTEARVRPRFSERIATRQLGGTGSSNAMALCSVGAAACFGCTLLALAQRREVNLKNNHCLQQEWCGAHQKCLLCGGVLRRLG